MKLQEAIKTARHKAGIDKIGGTFSVWIDISTGDRKVALVTNNAEDARITLAGLRFTLAVVLSTPPGVFYPTPMFSPGDGDWAKQARAFWREYIGPAMGGETCTE